MQRHLLVITTVLLLLVGAIVQAGNMEKAAVKQTADEQMTTSATVGKPAPDFTLMDAQGKKHSLSEYKDKYVVLEWVNFGCPFVKKFYNSGTMQDLQTKYGEKGVVWLSICSSGPGKQGYYDGEHLQEAIKEHNSHSAAYLVDADGTVGKLYNAKTTPNMFVINPQGILIYAGAMDDQPTPMPASLKDANNYVVDALDAAMAGKKVGTTTTQPYGCGVKYSQN